MSLVSTEPHAPDSSSAIRWRNAFQRARLNALLACLRKRQRIGAVFLYSFPRPAHCDRSPATKGFLCVRQFFVSNLVKKTTLSSGGEEPSGYWEGGAVLSL